MMTLPTLNNFINASQMVNFDKNQYVDKTEVTMSSDYDYIESSTQNQTFGLIANCTDMMEGLMNGSMCEPTINPLSQSWWQKTIWFIMFGGMVVIATGGNLIVIWIVLTEKRMRTVTNIFLVNLSVADTMVSTLNVVFNSIAMVSGHWPFGRIYCKISQFVALLSIGASVFTLMAISMDRYLAIMHPLRRRLGRKTTVGIVIAIWVIASIVASPNIIFYTTFEVEVGRSICYAEWPDGDQSESQLEYIHSIVIMILTYILPMLSMGFTYTQMGLMLWGSTGIGAPTQNQADAMRSKRKVVKMMIVVVTIFGVCWLPFHMYFILYAQIPEINTYKYIQEIYLSIYWLAMSNSMYNPMIYCWLNSRFRNGFKRVFAPWFPCVACLAEDSDRRRLHMINTNAFSSTGGSPDAVNRIIPPDGKRRNTQALAQGYKSSSETNVSPTAGVRSNCSSRSNTTTRTTLNGQDTNKLYVDPNGMTTEGSITKRNSIPRASTPV